VKIACYNRQLFDLTPGCQVLVLPHGNWYRVTSIVGNTITGERWLKGKCKWDRDHAVVISRRKIYYVVYPQYQEDRS